MGNRLLLADDSITIQKVVAIIFANEEFELTVVDNGTAALEKAREIKPDVMLVDALMPGKTGYEVCAEIRRDPKLNSVPILLLIGAFEPLDEEKARDCGADASISKPFESQQLIDRVKEMLALGKSRKSAPAPAAAPAGEPSAEELWGDLSSFDAMPAVEAPEAAAFPDAEAVWGNVAAEAAPAAAAPAVSVVAAAVQEELVEATQEDDLWGAFELEEVSSAPAAPPAQLFGVVEPEGEFEAEELFSFEEDDEDIEETGPALDLEPEAQVEEMPVSISEEEFFALAEEPVAAAEEAPAAAAVAESFQFPEYDPFAVGTEATEQQTPAAAALAAEPAKAPQPAAPAAAAAPPAELSEEQLVAALSKVSREVIERIVWEVVPDLAEVLIKEEIRKLRAGERG